MMRRSRMACLLAIAALAASPLAASAADPPAPEVPPEVRARGNELFQQGRAAMDQKDYRKALRLLQKSQEVDSRPDKLMAIAICEERMGSLVTALGHFKELDGKLPAGDPQSGALKDYLSKLPGRIPRLRIDLAVAAQPEMGVTLDGVPVPASSLGVEMPVDPGKRVVAVTFPGRPDKRYEVTLEEGKSASVSVEPSEAPPAPTVTARVTGPEPKRSLLPAILLGGAGVLALGAGGAFIGLHEAKRSDGAALRKPIVDAGQSCIKSAPNYDAARCPALADALSSGDTFGTVSIIGFAAGGLLAAGALTYWLWPGGGRARSGLQVKVAPAVGSGEQGIMVWGSF